MKLLCAKLNNGVLLPAVGFGTWQLIESDESQSAMITALQLGYRHIDTASAYENQNSVGKALQAFQADRAAECRDDVRVAGRFLVIDEEEFRGNFRVPHPEVDTEKRTIFVTGKVSTTELAQGEMGIQNAFEKHLKSLNRECADLIILHFPAPSGIAHDDPTLPEKRIEAWKVMEQLYKSKKARAIGVSNYMLNHLKPLIEDIRKRKYSGDSNATIPMVNQIEFSPYCLCDPELVKLCESEGIVMESYSTLGSPKGKDQILAEPEIQRLASEKQVAPSSIVLRWALEKNFVVLPRSRDAAHIKENLACLYIELSKQEEEMITELGRLHPNRFCWDPTKVN